MLSEPSLRALRLHIDAVTRYRQARRQRIVRLLGPNLDWLSSDKIGFTLDEQGNLRPPPVFRMMTQKDMEEVKLTQEEINERLRRILANVARTIQNFDRRHRPVAELPRDFNAPSASLVTPADVLERVQAALNDPHVRIEGDPRPGPLASWYYGKLREDALKFRSVVPGLLDRLTEKPDSPIEGLRQIEAIFSGVVNDVQADRDGQAATEPTPGAPATSGTATAPASKPEAQAELPDLVTLTQAAAMVHRNKRTLERYKTKGTLPAPAVEGGGGKPDLYDWSVLRPWLEQTFGIKLPETHPANRRNHRN